MKDRQRSYERPKEMSARRMLAGLLSIPWCCVGTFLIATTTITGSIAGLFFDDLMHKIIPFLVAFHLFGIVRYMRHNHKTQGQTLFLVFTTLFFVVSVGFHFTDFHDHLLGEYHDH